MADQQTGARVGSDGLSHRCSTPNPLHQTWAHTQNPQSYIHINTTSRPRQTPLCQSVSHIHTLATAKAPLPLRAGRVGDFGGQTETRLECWLNAATSALYEDGDGTLIHLSPLLKCVLPAISASLAGWLLLFRNPRVDVAFFFYLKDGLWYTSEGDTSKCQTIYSNKGAIVDPDQTYGSDESEYLDQ